MPESKSFAEQLLAQESDGARKAFAKERQPTAHAHSLRLCFKDGRSMQGVAWSFFNAYEWTDDGDVERLTILFTHRIVTIEGYRLARLIDMLDEARLKAVQEHDSREVALLLAENEHGHEEPKEIIKRITVEARSEPELGDFRETAPDKEPA